MEAGVLDGKGVRAWRACIVAVAVLSGFPALAQQRFPSPEAAAQALVTAVATNDEDGLGRVLGRQFRTLIPEGSVTRDDVYDFLGAWAREHRILPDGENRALLAVGESRWTFPVPIVRSGGGWQFDLREGRAEMQTRRLGRNELAAMEILRRLTFAQERYAEEVGDGRYATRLVSAAGSTDGLYWPTVAGDEPSPLGPDALVMGPDTPAADAFYGYHFRVIPPGNSGARYAFIAWPAQYGRSGVHSFLMSSDRVLLEADLGPGTASHAKAMKHFRPGEQWRRVDAP